MLDPLHLLIDNGFHISLGKSPSPFHSSTSCTIILFPSSYIFTLLVPSGRPFSTMKSALFFTSAIAALFNVVAADVVGAAEGFAKGVTGGAGGSEVTPTTTDELVSYLGDDEARIIYITKEFDFTGTEGTTSESDGCAAWGTDPACQVAINQNDWCKNYQPDAPLADVTYDNAATLAIKVGSNKSIVGVGSSGVLKGKGLRVVGGAQNVIIQNIKITELNPQYVWGGDAITLNDVDMVWIDHVTTSLIGRQHIVLGTNACGRVTISNCHIDGSTSWSATCDGYHYWALYFTGSNDVSVPPPYPLLGTTSV